MSVISMMLCCAMLVGTTFAWFTDEVVSTGNIIKSGTLDVTMEWADGKEDPATTTWTDASTGAIFDYDLWEPGYVQVCHVRIANVGTLALKYQLHIVANGKVSELADVIDVYYADPAVQVADRAAMSNLTRLGTLTEVLGAMSTTASGELEAGAAAHVVTLALKMQESAGNEYQDMTIGTDFSVKLVATQLTAEEDSFDDQYDKMATIDTEAELREALEADYDLIVLGANITLTESIVIPANKTVAIDLAGYTMSQKNAQQTTAYAMIDNQGKLTIEDSIGTGKISYEDATPYTADPGWASNTIRNTGTLTVNGGTIENITSDSVMEYGYPHAIDAYQGSVTTINGGTVKSLNYDSIRMFCNSDTLATTVNITGGTIINRVSFQDPASNRAGYGVLNITGGTFVTTDNVTANVRLLNFSNVSSNMKATVTGGTFDKGFKTQDIVNKGVKTSDWLNMGTGVTPVTTAAELESALASAGNGDTIVLCSGEYIIPDSAQGKTLKFVGLGNNVVIAAQDDGAAEGDCDYSFDGSTVTFENLTITTTATYFPGYVRMKGTYNNCTINGVYTLYDNSTFNGCTFNISGDLYNVWTWGANEATFNGCTFNSDGKAILLYGQANTKLTVNNCVFNDNGGLSDLKAAIEIGNDYGSSYELIVNNTVVNGYEINDKGINTGTTLWGNKNSMGTDKLNVVVDGVDVY